MLEVPSIRPYGSGCIKLDNQAAGMSWSGEGRVCDTLTGWFVVDSVTYVGETLTAIDLRFEQHCEGTAPALYGKIHWSQ
jgi:hypothetical protein